MSVDYPMQPVERAVFGLRQLYEKYGYKKFKMSKFEEYDLYLENKNFLPSHQIITFTGLSGRLLALKPDVTLSIAKNAAVLPGEPEKVYYNENVYRAPRGSLEFREISQVGLELIGEPDLYSQCEVVYLAYRSLELLSGDFVIVASHLGFVSGLLESLSLPLTTENELLRLIGHKNAHEIARVCDYSGLGGGVRERLTALTSLHGGFEETLERADKLVCNEKMAKALEGLREIYKALPGEISRRNLKLDFSVINDLSYYNGLIFQGYIPGLPGAVLSGGRYDRLMEKLGKKTGAIGFAVYVDELERFLEAEEPSGLDVLLLYDDETEVFEVIKAVESLSAEGKSVRVQKAVSGAQRSAKVMRIIGDGRVESVE